MQFFAIFHDKTQECNAKEHKDRIQVYPFVALHYDEHQCKGDEMQCKPLHHILNRALIIIMIRSFSFKPIAYYVVVVVLYTLKRQLKNLAGFNFESCMNYRMLVLGLEGISANVMVKLTMICVHFHCLRRTLLSFFDAIGRFDYEYL